MTEYPTKEDQACSDAEPLLFNASLDSSWSKNNKPNRSLLQPTSPTLAQSNLGASTSGGLSETAVDVVDQSAIIPNQASFIKWTDYNRIYENMYKMLDFPPPSVLHLSENYIAIGTSKAHVLIYNYNQFVMHVLAPEDPDFRSSLTKIVVSYDGTHLAASCMSGDILLWDLNKPKVSDENGNECIPTLFHIDYHSGCEVENLGFIAEKNNALAVCAVDKLGDSKVTYHRLGKSKIWANENLSLESIDMPMLLLPIQQNGGNRVMMEPLAAPTSANHHILGVLKSKSVQIFSINSQTGVLFVKTFKSPSSFVGSLAWNLFDGGSSLYFSRDNVLYYYSFDQTKPEKYELIIERSLSCGEPIIKITPINKFLVTVLTASGRVLIIDIFVNEHTTSVVTKLDISTTTAISPVRRSMACTCSQLAILTRSGLKMGKFSSWTTIIMQYLQSSDPVAAMDFLFKLSQRENDSVCVLLNLREDLVKRNTELAETFDSLLLASIKYFNKASGVEPDWSKLAVFFKQAVSLDRRFYGSAMKMSRIVNESKMSTDFKNLFYRACLELISGNSVSSFLFFPPELVQGLTEYCTKNAEKDALTHIAFNLSPACYDVDKLIRSLSALGLYEVLVFMWNSVFKDYITPLVDMVHAISGDPEGSVLFASAPQEDIKAMVFPYLASLMKGKVYPTEKHMAHETQSARIKMAMLEFVFSASVFTWPENSGIKIRTVKVAEQEPAFPYFRLLLAHDCKQCLSWLDQCFQDSFFNSTRSDLVLDKVFAVNRQYIIDLLLDIIKGGADCFLSQEDTKLMVIFIVRSYSTYEQFVFLSTKAMNTIFKLLCQDSLWKNYSEISMKQLVKDKRRRFPFAKYRDLLLQNGFYDTLVEIYFEENDFIEGLAILFKFHVQQKNVSAILARALEYYKNDVIALTDLETLLKDNFEATIKTGPKQAAQIVNKAFPDLHSCVLCLSQDSNNLKSAYLQEVFRLSIGQEKGLPNDILFAYFELLASKKNGDSELEDVLNAIEPTPSNVANTIKVLTSAGHSLILLKFLFKNSFFSEGMKQLLEALQASVSERPPHVATLAELTDIGLDICRKAESLDLWCQLFRELFLIFQSSPDSGARQICSVMVEKCIVTLTLEHGSSEGISVLTVLTRVFENGALILSRVNASEELLGRLFQTYEIEKATAELILKIFNRESSGLITTYLSSRSKGWLVLNQECKLCGAKIYGSFASTSEEKNTATTVFSCGHSYCSKCLSSASRDPEYSQEVITAKCCLQCTFNK